jgi:hypothetical protein
MASGAQGNQVRIVICALLTAQLTEADVVAEDIIVHYEKPAIYLHGPAMKQPTGDPVQLVFNSGNAAG